MDVLYYTVHPSSKAIMIGQLNVSPNQGKPAIFLVILTHQTNQRKQRHCVQDELR